MASLLAVWTGTVSIIPRRIAIFPPHIDTRQAFVELVGDTVFRLCPLTESDAGEKINEMKGRVLLRGYRVSSAADEAAFRRVLLAISELVDACPEIPEMDINPLMVLPRGAIAADVRIRIGQPPVRTGRRVSY